MVSHWVHEVVALNIGEVVGVWNLTIRNVIGSLVLLSPRLSLLKCFFEFISFLSELLLLLFLFVLLLSAFLLISLG